MLTGTKLIKATWRSHASVLEEENTLRETRYSYSEPRRVCMSKSGASIYLSR